MQLRDKINYEFQCFYLDLMRTSKENIFAHSQEIEIKKQLTAQLLFLAESLDETTASLLIVQNNLIESAYCFFRDIRAKNESEDMKEVLHCWLSFLKERSRKGTGGNGWSLKKN